MIEHKGTIRILTERLILRQFIEIDAEETFNNWCNDDAVTKYLTCPTHKDINVTKTVLGSWIKSYENIEFYQWTILLKAEKSVIGSISVVNYSNENEHCEIGYCIGRKYWGKGITTEALKAVILFLMEEVGFERIAAIHYKENILSGKVMEKAGMKYEGRRRNFHKNKAGKFADCESYAIIKEDRM